MKLKLFHLNIFQGKYLANLIRFLKKSDFDILSFQEIGQGAGRYTHITFHNPLPVLKKALPNHHVESLNYFKLNKKISSGNAIFFKNNLKLISRNEIWLNRPKKKYKKLADYRQPHAALALALKHSGKTVQIINTHLAWGPTAEDRKYKADQANRLLRYLKKINEPFILTGDFNLTPDTKIVKSFGKLAANLTQKYKIKNTLNPRVHYASNLFPPGLAVDYIFASKGIKIKKFKLVDKPDLSDHLGLALEFEI